jgi:hypothetical protein
MRTFRNLLAVPLALSFVACGPSSGNISGTVSAPTGVSVKNAIALAIVCTDNCTKLGADSTANTLVASDGSYTLTNVPGGQYVVGAALDTNGDNKSDYIGIYNAGAAVQPPANGINFKMVVFTGASSLSSAPNTSGRASTLAAIRQVLQNSISK